MPPSLREWLPQDHLAWTILDAVLEMDLSAFYGSYRADGHGRPAYEPSMMVALLLYAYAHGNRSSRGIERACCRGRGLPGDHGQPGSRITRRSPNSTAATRPLWPTCSAVSFHCARRQGS